MCFVALHIRSPVLLSIVLFFVLVVGTAAYRSRFENKVGPIRQRTSRAPPPIPEQGT